MGTIRINELARELEVKSKAVIDCLHELGLAEKASHSTAISDEAADKVRAYFKAHAESAAEEAPLAPAPKPSAPAAAARKPRPVAETLKSTEVRHEIAPATPMARSIAEIKAEARKVVTPARPLPAVEKPAATGPVSIRPAITAPIAPAARVGAPRPAPVASALPTAAPEVPVSTKVPEAPVTGKGAKSPRVVKSPASNQPIYPGVKRPVGVPGRPLTHRRPGEPRPMHPTAARPTLSAPSSPAAAGGAPGARPHIVPPIPMPARAPRIAPLRPAVPEEVPISRKITIAEGISIKELSEKIDARAKDVIKKLLDKGIFATINQTLDSQTAIDIARGFGAEASVVSYEDEVVHDVEANDRPEDLVARAPVVTVMGHVDHGKTSLLDAIRETNVTSQEAGGITQHIGAYHVDVQGRKVVFLDTPGHEAFTLMRARGAKVTDVVVLVVAADDGVMPQTIEAINHAQAAKVPIVVAVNKIDKPEAQPDRVKQQLADRGLLPEAWGGNTVTVDVSAKQRKNLDLLLEMILLVADLQALKANPKRLASGTVLEAKLDRGRGPVATVLVQNGTLHVGSSFIVGAIYGKVRAMFDDRGQPTSEAWPSTPVEVLGLEDVPAAGDRFQVIEDTLKARQIALHRQAKLREAALAKSARLTLEQLHEQLAAGDVKELSLIIKGDVQGSVEVLADTLAKLSTEKVKVKVIHAGVGAITESDVLLATASNAVIVGFNVRPERKAAELAQLEKVDIRLHTIIYDVTSEVKKAMSGLLVATYKETTVGRAEVRETFRISKVGNVAGCQVQDGKIARDSKVRLLRDDVVVYEGRVRSLRRFKDDVSEVRSGMECGITLENFSDVKIGDAIEAFTVEKVAEPAIA